MENNINKIIQFRRSHYPSEFSGKILDNSIIQTLVQNAHWAPNHTLNYPWRFKILEGQQIINWLDKALEIYKIETPIELQKESKTQKLTHFKTKISHVIAIVCVQENAVKYKAIENISAVACGIQNMYLSLSQFENAVGYWSTGLGTYSEHMHSYLNLTENQQLMGFFILGEIENKRTESNRKSYSDFLL